MDSAGTKATRGPAGVCACRALEQPPRKPRLLYVDHDPRSLIGITTLLVMSGYVVFSTQSPLQALDLAKNIPLNGALLDCELPTMTGAELARQIRRLKPMLPIAMFSASGFKPREVVVVADRYLRKDADGKHLLRQLNSWTNTLQQAA
jgi:CheY-like chemotaxis protein